MCVWGEGEEGGGDEKCTWNVTGGGGGGDLLETYESIKGGGGGDKLPNWAYILFEWFLSLGNKQLQMHKLPISQEVKAIKQWNLVRI